jgi:hypothetical protein
MTSQPDEQRLAAADWLDGCVGFVVESDAGHLGRVVGVQRDTDSGRPVALILRAGMAGMRRLVVPVDEVAGVLSSSGRIILGDSTPPVALEDPWSVRPLPASAACEI